MNVLSLIGAFGVGAFMTVGGIDYTRWEFYVVLFCNELMIAGRRA